MNGSELYRRVQSGRIMIAIMAPIAVVAFALLIWLNLIGAGEIISNVTLASVSIIMLVLGWLFSSLTIVVTSSQFEFWIGPGLARNVIPIDRIDSVKPVRNMAISGLGIKYGPGYTIYSVSGLDAVEVVYRKEGSGKERTIRVGTDDQEPLMSAVNLALRNRKKADHR